MTSFGLFARVRLEEPKHRNTLQVAVVVVGLKCMLDDLVIPYCEWKGTIFGRSLQIISKDSQVKTQLVLWIFILFKMTS